MKMKTAKDEKYRKLAFIFVFFLFSLGCLCFSILCVYEWQTLWFQKNAIWVAVSIFALFFALFLISVGFVIYNKETFEKIAISGFILLQFTFILLYILLRTDFFSVIKNAEALQGYLEKAGIWMPLLYILLQYLQVVILPIPSVVSTLAGVALFGAFKALVYSLMGILLGSITAFFIGRKLGSRAVSWMIGKETLIKWQRKLKGKDNLFLTIMFVLPLFPDDILCFLAGLSSMSTRYFISMVCISRAVGIAGTCYSIDFIPFTTWWGILIWCLFFVSTLLSFLWIYKNMDAIQSKLKDIKKKISGRNKNG